MPLDLLNRDLNSTDPLAKMPLDELLGLAEQLGIEYSDSLIVHPGDSRSPDEIAEKSRSLRDRRNATLAEINKRKSRLSSQRGPFWIVIFMLAFPVAALLVWLTGR